LKKEKKSKKKAEPILANKEELDEILKKILSVPTPQKNANPQKGKKT
jgi:hypothetical protein